MISADAHAIGAETPFRAEPRDSLSAMNDGIVSASEPVAVRENRGTEISNPGPCSEESGELPNRALYAPLTCKVVGNR